MSHSENTPIEDPPRAEWIDQCAREMGALLTAMSPDCVTELAAEAWPDARGHMSPTLAARTEVWALEDESGLPAYLIGAARPPNTTDKAAWIARFEHWLFGMAPTDDPPDFDGLGQQQWEACGRSTTPEDAAIQLAWSWRTPSS